MKRLEESAAEIRIKEKIIKAKTGKNAQKLIIFAETIPLNVMVLTLDAWYYLSEGNEGMAVKSILQIKDSYLIPALQIIANHPDAISFATKWNTAFIEMGNEPGIIVNQGLIVSLPGGK